MRSDLIWGWISAVLALIGIILVVFCVCIGNWPALPMCAFALGLNIINSITHFCDYKWRQQDWKDCMARFDDAFNACWPEDKPDDDNRITD